MGYVGMSGPKGYGFEQFWASILVTNRVRFLQSSFALGMLYWEKLLFTALSIRSSINKSPSQRL